MSIKLFLCEPSLKSDTALPGLECNPYSPCTTIQQLSRVLCCATSWPVKTLPVIVSEACSTIRSDQNQTSQVQQSSGAEQHAGNESEGRTNASNFVFWTTRSCAVGIPSRGGRCIGAPTPVRGQPGPRAAPPVTPIGVGRFALRTLIGCSTATPWLFRLMKVGCGPPWGNAIRGEFEAI